MLGAGHGPRHRRAPRLPDHRGPVGLRHRATGCWRRRCSSCSATPPSSTAAASSSAPSTRRSAWPSTWPRRRADARHLRDDVNPGLPRSVPVLAPPIALLICAAGRWFYRALRDRRHELDGPRRPSASLIYGAGDAGRQVLQLLRNEPIADEVVGFLDDNPGKRHLRISGVPVLGDGEQLARRRGRRTRSTSSSWPCPRANGAVHRTGPGARRRRPASTSSSCRGSRR